MNASTFAGVTLCCLAALSSCQTAPQFPNAPPEVVEECRRQVVVMTERDPGLAGTEPLSERTTDTGENPIDEARTGRAEAEARNLAAWPEEILLYRCLVGRGVELDPEQARELAEWEAGLDE